MTVAFAVLAVLILAGASFFAATYLLGKDSGGEESLNTLAHDETLGRLQSLGAPMGMAEAQIDASSSAVASAQAESLQVLADALASIDAGASTSLEELATIQEALHAAAGGAFGVGQTTGSIGAAAGSTFHWSSMPTSVTEGGSPIPTTGEAEVDAALAHLADVLAQIEALLQSEEVQAVFATLEGSGVPVPGVVTDPAGAGGAVEPAEEMAAEAAAHADVFLSTVGGGYGNLESSLEALLTAQQGVVSEAQAAIASAEAYRVETMASLEAELEARLAAVQSAAAAYEAAVQAAADEAVAEAEAYLAEVKATVESTLAEETAKIETAVAEAKADIDAAVAATQAEAAARLEATSTVQTEALARLKAAAAAGVDVQGQAEAITARLDETRAKIEAEVIAAHAMAAAAKSDLEAQADAHIAGLQEQAAVAILAGEDHLDAVQAFAAEKQAELLADVSAELEHALATQTLGHASAVAQLEGIVGQYKAEVRSQAGAIVATGKQTATHTAAVVPTVTGEAISEVGADLDAILKVAEDYAAVPTPEREARAQFWMEAHGRFQGTLDGAVSQGDALMALAGEVLVEADAAAAGLAAI